MNANGPRNLPPKGHFINHIPFTLQPHPVLAHWAHERKHREVKRFANGFTNAHSTLSFVQHLMKTLLLSQMHALQSGLTAERGSKLVSPSPASNTVVHHVLANLGASMLMGWRSLVPRVSCRTPFDTLCRMGKYGQQQIPKEGRAEVYPDH